MCATWEKSLPDLGVDEATLPPWGPSAAQLSACIIDAHLPARGEDRHYRGSANAEDDGEEDMAVQSGGEEEDFEVLEAIARADVYRNVEEVEYY